MDCAYFSIWEILVSIAKLLFALKKHFYKLVSLFVLLKQRCTNFRMLSLNKSSETNVKEGCV